ncbi:MAG: RDD family protein [Bacteroidota bacterium]|nr:RDD family protein [Bacteroidota bacterium]
MTPPPEPQAATTPAAAPFVAYAGFWRRVAASILDGIVGAGVAGILFLLILISSGGLSASRQGNAPAAFASIMLLYVVFVFGGWLYCTLMESSKYQGTIGKLALSQRVTDLEGKRITFGRANARFFARFLSSMTCGIGYIMAAFTQKKQTLHDMVAGTLVLSQQSSVPPSVAQNAFQS